MKILDDRASWLEGRQRNETSQFGEDGLIEAALERFGAVNQWCFEVGASDGLDLSNTKRLRDAGWNAVLVEADDKKFAKLEEFTSPTVRTVHARIGTGDLDRILLEACAPAELDLGVIDIDNQDFWVWAGLQLHHPRLMLVEFNPEKPQQLPRLNDEDRHIPNQAGFDWIFDLGVAKGYAPLVQTDVNILFAKAKLLEAL